MAALLGKIMDGKIEPFDPDAEEWPEYVERLGQFFEANNLVGEAKAMSNAHLVDEALYLPVVQEFTCPSEAI